MGMLAPVLAASSTPSAWDDFWYGPVSRDHVGPIDPESPMTIPAFYAAVTYVAEDIAKLPLSMYEDLGRKLGTEPADEHELQPLLHDQPNKRQTALEYREMVTAWSMLRGKAVSEIRPGPTVSAPGHATRTRLVGELVPLHPDLLREETARSDGTRRFIYRDPMKQMRERTLLEDEVFVVRGRQSRSVLDFAAANLTTILSTDRFARFMFQRGAKHQGVISAKGKLPDPVKNALRTALDEYAIDGPRAGRPLILEDGMTWQQVTMTLKDSELLASQQWSVSQVCRWIRIPPHKVFDLTRSTNNNIETQGVDYVTDCILAWAVRWEQAILRDLVVDKSFFPKHILDGLLRGDFEARAKAYSLAIMWGWMTRNEVRQKEDLNPIDGLDLPLTPENMTTDPDGGVTVQYPKTPQTPQQLTAGDVGRLQLIAADVASRVVRREVAAVSKLAERTAGDVAAWRAGVTEFYADQAERIASELHIPMPAAVSAVEQARTALLENGAPAMDDWLVDRARLLADLAMAQPEIGRTKLEYDEKGRVAAIVEVAA